MPDGIGPSKRTMFDALADMVVRNLGGTPRPEPTYDMGFKENVTVKPEDPGIIDPYKYKQSAFRDITLGSPGKPPTGVYLPPETYNTEIPEHYPNIRSAFERAKKEHPDLASRVRGLSPRRDWLGTTQMGGIEPEGQTLKNIEFNPVIEQRDPEDTYNTIEHELVHYGRNLNSPNRWDSENADEFPAYYSTEGRLSPPMLSDEQAKKLIEQTNKASQKYSDDEWSDFLKKRKWDEK